MSSVPPLYKNIGKNYKDLVEKKYDFTREVRAKTTTASGVVFETAGRTGHKTSDYAGALKATYKHSSFGTFESEFDTEGRAKGSVEAEDFVRKGVTAKLSVDQAPTTVVDVSYRMVNLSVTATASAGPKGSAVEVAGVVGHQGLFVGGTTKVDGNTKQLTDYNVGAQYSKGDFVVAARTTDRLGRVSASYVHNVNADMTVGASGVYNLEHGAAESAAVATSYAFDRNTSVKAKINTNKVFTAAVEQRLENPRVKVGLTSEYHLANQSFTPERFGISLAFGDN